MERDRALFRAGDRRLVLRQVVAVLRKGIHRRAGSHARGVNRERQSAGIAGSQFAGGVCLLHRVSQGAFAFGLIAAAAAASLGL